METKGTPCAAFAMDSAEEALKHMAPEPVVSYGSEQHGNILHTWDRGGRILFRCQNCGGYILYQSSEYTDPVTGKDTHYDDYFPVSGAEEADRVNRLYDGFSIERDFPRRSLMVTGGKAHWSVMNEKNREEK